jgi:hypothetical protein
MESDKPALKEEKPEIRTSDRKEEQGDASLLENYP